MILALLYLFSILSVIISVSGCCAGLGAGYAGPGLGLESVSLCLTGLGSTGDWSLDHHQERVTPGGAHQETPGSDWLTEEILSSDWARDERGAGR